MKLTELCEKIGLPKEAAQMVCRRAERDKTYDAMRGLYQKDREAFYKKTAEEREPEELLLYYYCRFACEACGNYREREPGDRIVFDTFRDIGIWCDEYYQETGKYGLGRYVQDWFWRAFEGKILRLGRLEFEEMEAEEELAGKEMQVKKGEPVISIHIPAGEPLGEEACRASIEEAFRVFGPQRQYLCHSWLLFPGLSELLPEKSGILRFQNFFDVVKIDYREREAEWRIFGRRFFRVADYSEETSLQRHAKEYLLSGRSLGNGWGILKKFTFLSGADIQVKKV